MATAIAGVVSVAMDLFGASESSKAQKKAAKATQEAGRATASSILAQSAETKRRMRESQKGMMGTAIARAAASGITLDAEALGEIEFGRAGRRPTREEYIVTPGKESPFVIQGKSYFAKQEDLYKTSTGRGDIGIPLAHPTGSLEFITGKGVTLFDAWTKKESPEYKAQKESEARFQAALSKYMAVPITQVGGELATDSLSAYVTRAKETFALELDWESRFATKQAAAARKGGQVSFQVGMAGAKATELQGWGQAASTAYQVWGKE